MARFEVPEVDLATMGQQVNTADLFFELGISYSVGRGVPTDRIAAHKWFNLAAARGNADASRYRREISGEMTKAEVIEAQRQAREYVSLQ
ncbi:MAG: SEL1-like repeat protein [Ancalomicrobiaceae bacterium]|nr:SEL1-like repeat protein [Ancalomicrobiaceae bacterium]